jgi:hypothetical protein
MSVALQGFVLKQLIANLRDLDAAINGRARHSRVLVASHKNFDARLLLETATNYKRATAAFEALLISIAGQAEVAMRATPKRPPSQIGIGQFTHSFGGELAEIRGLCSRLPRDLAKLDEQVNALMQTANTDINSPLRTSTPSSPLEPGKLAAALQLADTLLQVSDMVAKIRERYFSGR